MSGSAGARPPGFRSPPDYIESPLEQIINVNWGGLAVHFGAKEGPPGPPQPSGSTLSASPTTRRTRVIKTVR